MQRPGLYPFRDSMTLKDAVILAGGLRDDAHDAGGFARRADRKRTYVIILVVQRL